jgi:hypothetical protein
VPKLVNGRRRVDGGTSRIRREELGEGTGTWTWPRRWNGMDASFVAEMEARRLRGLSLQTKGEGGRRSYEGVDPKE